MTTETRWEAQRQSLRDPLEIVSFPFASGGLESGTASVRTEGRFVELLEELQVTLLITREYENLVLALGAKDGRLQQSFMPLPHPSGMTVDRERGAVYLAATRNPNMIYELCPVQGDQEELVLLPSRAKFYPGRYYFHDLAMVGGQLHANSVGQNGVIAVDFASPQADPLSWWPRCIERQPGQPESRLNYIQLNSIAAGPSLEESYFTASCAQLSARRPWHVNYPVDGRGVLFSGSSREVVGRGLTRPHSARFYDQKVWVNNSGYGQVGYFDGEAYQPQWDLPGWTRGLCFHDQVAWVGVSRVLPKFAHYAPGLRGKKVRCGLFALSMKSGEILGSLTWPQGNQIFAIEWVPRSFAAGFPHSSLGPSRNHHRQLFYGYHQPNRKKER